ncbi:hypothetical protein ACS0TY_005294 [Phlomoides rotata]
MEILASTFINSRERRRAENDWRNCMKLKIQGEKRISLPPNFYCKITRFSINVLFFAFRELSYYAF